ncbi:hypothetical protein [Williamsia sp.]|uniref:hypothetical protein n=1 Tax=Williamsia sp. TaxID=1872085 RepID=UPI001A1DD5CF|nr:hypothetical protein [Williamsia sp.]MBJ7287552.1 hypothetical protein [Williamsia sp.]
MIASDDVGRASQSVTPPDALDFNYVEVPADVLREGLALIQRLTPSAAVDADVATALIRFAHKLSAAHATEVLERFGGPGRTVPGFLQTAFGPYLLDEVPFDDATVQQRDDQRYRRWLIGIAEDTDGRFSNRFDRKMRAISVATH